MPISILKNIEVQISPLEKPVCDVCGEDATNFARDMIATLDPSGWIRYTPHGKTKYGCDKHPAESDFGLVV